MSIQLVRGEYVLIEDDYFLNFCQSSVFKISLGNPGLPQHEKQVYLSLIYNS